MRNCTTELLKKRRTSSSVNPCHLLLFFSFPEVTVTVRPVVAVIGAVGISGAHITVENGLWAAENRNGHGG